MIAKFSVKKPYTVLVGVIMVIVLGIVSFTDMTTDLLPSIDLPYIIVLTTYPGASPETVETVVTAPIESSMATVSNIENVTSTSAENYSMVMLEFSQTADMDSASIEIRENLDQIATYWDDTVGNPIIMKINPDMMAIMVVAMGMEGMSDAEISEFAENSIIPELESIEGVASATASGLVEESVHVIIRQDKIDAINLQVFGYIDSEMADAESDLADGWKELYDGESEIYDGYTELDESAQEIADGKVEIADGKTELANGQTELDSAQSEMAAELAEAETLLLTYKAQLEANKVSISSNISTVEMLAPAIEEAQTGLDALESVASVLTGVQASLADLMTFTSVSADTGSIADADSTEVINDTTRLANDSDENRTDAQNTADAIGYNSDSSTTTDDTTSSDAEAEIAAKLTTLYTEIATVKQVFTSMSVDTSALDALNAEILQEGSNIAVIATQLNYIIDATLTTSGTGLNAQISSLTTTISNLNTSLTAITMGMSSTEYVSTMNSALDEIEDGLDEIDDGLTELASGSMTAAIEIAVAQAELSAASTQLDSLESQLDSAEEQLDSGREQLDDALSQLQDAKDQLADGEEQLAEAWENAYNSADMKGILTVDTVKSLLAAQNFSMPGGYITEEGIDYLVRIGDKPEDVEALASMPIMNVDMEGVDVIYLSDVADVFMTDNSADIYTSVNGAHGVMISIQKQTGYSTGDVSGAVQDRFDELLVEYEDLTLISLMDQGVYIELVMDSIISNVIFGAILAIFILILFLRDLRPTFVIACSIPISLVAALVCMYFSGVTLNVISLAGLALGVGMLVDNSIVVIENIYRLRNLGYSMKDAAMTGAKEVSGAIMASTLTTVCVFAPIVFTEGITRQLFVDMGLTIGYSLVASLAIALTVVPAMASKILTKTSEKEESKLMKLLVKGYDKILKTAIRFKIVVLIFVVVLLGVSIVASLSKGTAFMPGMDSNQLSLTVQLPNGTPLTETAEVTNTIIERIETIEDIQDIGAMVGGSSEMAMMGMSDDGTTNATSIYLTTVDDKTMTNEEIAAVIYELTADIENAEIEVTTESMDMSSLTGSGISIQINGRELDTLQELALDMADMLSEVEGLTEIDNGMGETTDEVRIIIDRDKAIDHGLTVAQVYLQIAEKIADPSSATTLTTEIKDYDVLVMDGENMELTRENLQELDIEITNQDGTKEWVAITEIATFEEATGMNSISRSNQTRYMQVSGAIADGYNVGLVGDEVEKLLADYEMPSGYNFVITGEDESINDAMEQIMLMMLLAVIFMYLIMVAQFQSLLSPFIIMFTIPLAFTGGFLGLYFTNSEVSVIGLIGFVMLAGIIVNNGIVLVDYMNQLRESGLSKKEAIYEAGRTRLRPVLMTALTTILALSTMAFSDDMGSDMAKPMAIVTIGGLMYGTLLTLIVIPCIYDIFSREKKEVK